jgi:hypothetical protein
MIFLGKSKEVKIQIGDKKIREMLIVDKKW